MRYFISCLLLISAEVASGQEYYITANSNLYVPSNSAKAMFPIIGADKDQDPALLIGGFGVGVSAFKALKGKFSLKGQANFSRHAYWDTSIDYVNTGSFIDNTRTIDYVIGTNLTGHYFITPSLSFGTGLGAQFMILSYTRISKQVSNSNSTIANHYYKPVMPVIPFEVSLKLPSWLFTVRYEYGLINRYKGDLAQYKNEKYSLVTFEVGFRMKRWGTSETAK